jgi:hypothetical protein
MLDAGQNKRNLKVSESEKSTEVVAKSTFGLDESSLGFGYVSSISYLHLSVFKG